MSMLRQYIRQILLTEAAKGLKDLEVEDLYISIQNWNGGFSIDLGGEDNPGPVGEIFIEKSDKVGPCGGAFMVGSSNAMQGWGPLLYDLAIEYATEIGAGLMPDRGSVSADAQGVWQYYMQNRGDVTAHQLDDSQNTLTSIPEDNCDQEVAGGYYWGFDNERNEDPEDPDWMNSPLSKMWTKSPTTLNALRAGDRLLEE